MASEMLDRPSVRPATETDATAINALYATVVTDTAISFEETPPNAVEMVQRMLSRPRLPWLVAEIDRHLVGFAYASRHRHRAAYRWSADCSVYVDPVHHRRGIGRALYARLLDDMSALGYRSLFAGIALPNPASIHLHEVMGFEPVGVFRDVGYKFAAWRDVGWWQRRLPDLPFPPPEPREWGPRPSA